MKRADSMNLLAKWASWTLHTRKDASQEDIDLANAVLNLLSEVGHIRRATLEEAAKLCESQEDFCCGGATLRCAKLIRSKI